ncbi:universal stress protein [Saccharopolyspora subtropica]|uniref:Universal stress protein n=1 Tax=Saccharopolyspora thermophila TaxID=89367 RepID=A0A917JT67_9PSEU|nr:universal stress protein [Saccharopolyspora subtropica]GGI84549.1 universal stress protein [Saccharopolyspora subtropica]
MRRSDVVGVDGSETALEAVRWAAADAAAHRVPLRLVCAVPFGGTASAELPPGRGLEIVQAERQRWLLQAANAARDAAEGVEVEQELRHGKPAQVLLDESERAWRVVVGTRGLGEYTGVRLALGSTAEQVAMRASCPAVVVPGGTEPVEALRGRPVIVGVDGSPVGEQALATAYAEAAIRRVPLVAVHVWSDVVSDEWLSPDVRDWESIKQAEDLVLAERLAGWQEKYPDVAVQRVVVRDRPVRFLVEHGALGQLIVVGSRGRGGLTGMLLGSTSRALLHSAPCPVMVVRA